MGRELKKGDRVLIERMDCLHPLHRYGTVTGFVTSDPESVYILRDGIEWREIWDRKYLTKLAVPKKRRK